jgi:hypothetical protein
MKMATYYREHPNDPSKYLRLSNARKIASVGHVVGGEIGIISEDSAGRIKILVIALSRTIRSTTKKLVEAGRSEHHRPA